MSWIIKADAEKERLTNLIFAYLQLLEENGIDQYDPVWGEKLMEGSGYFEEGDYQGALNILKDIVKQNHLGEVEER